MMHAGELAESLMDELGTELPAYISLD